MVSLWFPYGVPTISAVPTSTNDPSLRQLLHGEHCSTPADFFWRRNPKNLEELRSQAQLIVNINGGLMVV